MREPGRMSEVRNMSWMETNDNIVLGWEAKGAREGANVGEKGAGMQGLSLNRGEGKKRALC